MTASELKFLVQQIVARAAELKNTYTTEATAPVNYACIFSQSPEEYQELLEVVGLQGKVVQQTKMGPVFALDGFETVSGTLKLLKVRLPDPSRPEQGDADFTVQDYLGFKARYLSQPGFSLIQRENMEMIELVAPGRRVRAYFSHPPLAKVLGLE